ncbi:hypothetical protein BJY00DRAFT_297153 [Aspergillus carlsbadensis]|nr:hypothetical protein BJY00DRAFT_297153 [Aspergillus carlsbadensis]
MRLATSCSTCRLRKKRCIILTQGLGCMLCASKSLECNLAAQDVKAVTSSSPESTSYVAAVNYDHPGSSQNRTTDSEKDAVTLPVDSVQAGPLCEELVELYFTLIHGKQHILFHQWSFMADLEAGIVPGYILLAIVTLVSRFSTNDLFRGIEPCDRASSFLWQAMRSFNDRSEPISIYSLQGSILLSYVCFVEGQHHQEALLAAQAISMVQILRLPSDLAEDSILQETQIRLFWQAWMMDTWNSFRSQVPRRIQSAAEYPRPLEEVTFDQLRPNSNHISPSSPVTGLSRHCGIWSNVVELTNILAQVVDLNQMIVSRSVSPSTSDSIVQSITIQLDQWTQNLPGHLQDTPQNFELFMNSGRGREFTVLHLTHHHLSQLLYYQYLRRATSSRQGNEPDSQAIGYAELCRAHAEALSTLMWSMNTAPGMDCLWSPVNGHLLVIASTVHLHYLLMDEDSLRQSNLRRLLEQNFVMLLQFRTYWPSLVMSISRLHAFHRACQVDIERQSCPLDDWMLVFIDRYDLSFLQGLDGGESVTGERTDGAAHGPSYNSSEAEDAEFWRTISGDTTVLETLNASLSLQR